MRIMLMITGMESGGAERVMSTLANEFVKKNDVCLVIMKSAKTDYFISEKVAIRAGNVENQNVRKCVMFSVKQIKEWKPDVILSFMTKTNIIALISGAISKTNNKVIIAERANPFNAKKIFQIVRKILYPYAAGAVFQTKEAQDYYRDIIKHSSIVLRNPLNPDFSAEAYEGIRRKAIVTVGRLSEEKNQKLLIEAFSKIADLFPAYSVEIYGEGPLHENLQSQIDALNLHERVQLMGRKNDVRKYIKDAAVFVLPSNSEGMPNALLEAMAMGIPSIATDCPIGGSAFIIRDHENGILLPMNDADALARAIAKLIEDPDLAKILSREACRVTEDYAAEKVCAEWEAYLKEVANRG